MTECPQCGESLEEQWTFCPACQAPLTPQTRDIGAGPVAQSPSADLSDCYQNSWAVVVGINEYRDVPKLSYGVADAEAVAEALTGVGFKRAHIITLLDADATRQNIQDTLSVDMARKTTADDRLLVFFAGHGQDYDAASGRTMGYLIPIDGNPEYLASRCISMAEVDTWSELIPAKHILFVMDCCYSGLAATRDSGVNSSRSDFINEVVRRPTRQIITAGRADQRVLEDGGQGIFSRAFIRGIQGDADLHGRGFVTGCDLGNYLETRVYEESRSRQQPLFRYLSGDGEFIFVVEQTQGPCESPNLHETSKPETDDPASLNVVAQSPDPRPSDCDSSAHSSKPQADVSLGRVRYSPAQDHEHMLGSHRIDTFPNRAHVHVDGWDHGKSPVVVDASAELHNVRIIHNRCEPFEEWVTFDSNSNLLQIELEEKAKDESSSSSLAWSPHSNVLPNYGLQFNALDVKNEYQLRNERDSARERASNYKHAITRMLPHVGRSLSTAASEERIDALNALCESQAYFKDVNRIDDSLLASLLAAFRDDEPLVAVHAIQTAGDICRGFGMGPELAVLATECQDAAAWAALVALKKVGVHELEDDDRSELPLIALLGHRYYAVRMAAIDFLLDVGRKQTLITPEIVDSLETMAKTDSCERLRQAAFDAVEKMHPREDEDDDDDSDDDE